MQRLRIISGVCLCVCVCACVRARALGGGGGSRFEYVNEFVQAGKKAKYSLPVTSLIIYNTSCTTGAEWHSTMMVLAVSAVNIS